MAIAPSSRASRRGLRLVTAAAAAVTTVATSVVAVPTAQAGLAVPRSRPLPAQVDAYAAYQGQSTCSPAPKIGAVRLAALLRATYGPATIGISRRCSIGGQSEHKEGRALDWMLSAKVPGQRARVNAFLAWLLRPDAQGRPAEMARRLGVMYLGWNDHFWAAYRPDAGWTDLKGCSTDRRKRAAGYDTYCHRNHLHISLSWEGAAGLTSFWSGTPVAAPCDSGWDAGWAVPAGPAAALVPVPAVRVLDTLVGTGLDAPCRVTASDGWWDATSRDVVVHVTGVGGLPADGVAAVAVRVTASRSVGPARTVWVRTTTSTPLVRVVTWRSGAATSPVVVVPVADDGTIRLRVDAGSTDVAVDVVGWAPLLAPPPTPSDSPTPDPSSSADPSSSPGPSPSPSASASPSSSAS